MAVCGTCDREMETADSCVERPDVLRFGSELLGASVEDGWAPEELIVDLAGRCGDCGVAVGGVHHPHCDTAICGRCQMQRLLCGCDLSWWERRWLPLVWRWQSWRIRRTWSGGV